jgi:tRNA(Arg) A34 adenosine deaminase TadA
MTELQEILSLRTLAIEDVFVECYAIVINPKEASSVLGSLSAQIPLQRYGLGHVKRVRRKPLLDDDASIEFKDGGSYRYALEVLLCPESEYQYLAEEVKNSVLGVEGGDQETGGKGSGRLRKVKACKFAPLTKDELLLFTKGAQNGNGAYTSTEEGWPVIFRPSLEVRTRDTEGTVYGHTKDEVEFVGKVMGLVKADEEVANSLREDSEGKEDEAEGVEAKQRGGAVVINPKNNQVVAVSSDYYQLMLAKYGEHKMLRHPCMSAPCCAAMRVIEAVAMIVRGEAKDPGKKHPIIDSSKGREQGAPPLPAGEDEQALPDDFYLCTGLDVFLSHEPDLMTAMALTHSRVRRVYFTHNQAGCGALESHYQLHARRDLNHRYRAFRVSTSSPSSS